MKYQLTDIENVKKASHRLKETVRKTPLQYNERLSQLTTTKLWLKREDLQEVRSFKIRGAYNKISSLNNNERNKGVVCSSAGNHAQGVAKSCNLLKIEGVIFMPTITPRQKIEQVNMFGGKYINVILDGDTYDDAYEAAKKYCNKNNKTFIHPFDDESVIEGQATLALEILEQANEKIDAIIVPVGGGSLISGVLSVFKQLSPETKIIGVEPEGAPSMSKSLTNNTVTSLDKIDPFVDGASVKELVKYHITFAENT